MPTLELLEVMSQYPGVWWVGTLDGRILQLSPNCESEMGIKPEALLGRRAETVFPAHTTAQFRAAREHAVRKGKFQYTVTIGARIWSVNESVYRRNGERCLIGFALPATFWGPEPVH